MSLTQEYQGSLDRREREESQVVLDSQGSLVGLALLVQQWDQIFPAPVETPASQDLMESMVSRVPQVLQDQQVQEHPRETEETLDCQVSLVPLVGKENQEDLEVLDSLVAQVLKVKEARLVSVVVQVSRDSLVTLVTMETKDQKDSEGLLVVRVFLALCCQDHLPIMIENMETWEFLVKMEPLVLLESPVSLECLDVQVLRDVLVLLVN